MRRRPRRRRQSGRARLKRGPTSTRHGRRPSSDTAMQWCIARQSPSMNAMRASRAPRMACWPKCAPRGSNSMRECPSRNEPDPAALHPDASSSPKGLDGSRFARHTFPSTRPYLSWIEYLATNQVVGGSNPSGRAMCRVDARTRFGRRCLGPEQRRRGLTARDTGRIVLDRGCSAAGCTRGIAQSGSAPALGAGCRGFESLYPDQLSAGHGARGDGVPRGRDTEHCARSSIG